MEKTTEPTKEYFGIADCHGIESFREYNEESKKDLPILMVRADTNRQRHAILYIAKMTRDGTNTINSMLKKGEFELALEVLKATAVEFRCTEQHAKSINLIPNPELDPWR